LIAKDTAMRASTVRYKNWDCYAPL